MSDFFNLLRGLFVDFAFVGLALLCCLCVYVPLSSRVRVLRAWTLPWMTRLALGVLMLTAVFAVAKQGGTNNTDRAGASARIVCRTAVADVARVEAMTVTAAGVDLVLHRPAGLASSVETVVLAGSAHYAVGTHGGTADFAPGAWRALRTCTFPVGTMDLPVSLSRAELGDLAGTRCFFTFVGAGDADDDGLADWEELLNEGSDPYNAYSLIDAIAVGQGNSISMSRAYRDGFARRFGNHAPDELLSDGYTVFEHALYAGGWNRPMPSPLVVGTGDAVLEVEVTCPAVDDHATLVIGSRRVPLRPGWTQHRLAVAVDAGEWLGFGVEEGPGWFQNYATVTATPVASDAFVLRRFWPEVELGPMLPHLLVLPYPHRPFCLHPSWSGVVHCAYGVDDGYEGSSISVAWTLLDGMNDVAFANASVLGVDVAPMFPRGESRRAQVAFSHRDYCVGPTSAEVEIHCCPKPPPDIWTYNVWAGDAHEDWRRPSELWPRGAITCGCCDEGAPPCPCGALVCSFDRDGDGLVDEVDGDSLVAQPSVHNANADWYATVCGAVFEKSPVPELPDERTVELPDGGRVRFKDGVNAHAYYFVDVIAESGPARIDFTADGNSELPDPVVVALAGMTNRVPLLIGATYTVSSSEPISVSVPENGYAEVMHLDREHCSVSWPLRLTLVGTASASGCDYSLDVSPYDPGGRIEWMADDVELLGVDSVADEADECRCVSFASDHAYFWCGSRCRCGGTCRARGNFILGGRAFPFEGGNCTCVLEGETVDLQSLDQSLGLTISLPAFLLLKSGWIPGSRSASLTFTAENRSDKSWTLTFWIPSGSEKVLSTLSPTRNFTVDAGQRLTQSIMIDGVSQSATVDDVSICFSYGSIVGRRTLTVVNPISLSVPTAPETGLVVLSGSTVPVHLTSEPQIDGVAVEWLVARRKNRDVYDPWRRVVIDDFDSSLVMSTPGIYAICARATNGIQSNEVVFVHGRSERDSHVAGERKGPTGVGMRDHIGVSSSQLQINIRNAALAQYGTTAYALKSSLPERNGFMAVPVNAWKCNAFVADMAIAGGGVVLPRHSLFSGVFGRARPPLANEWADRNVEIPNWEVLDSTAYPEPGFIVAFPNPRGSGHVGIVDYDGWTINARELAVSRYGLKMLDSKCVYRKPIVQSEENR